VPLRITVGLLAREIAAGSGRAGPIRDDFERLNAALEAAGLAPHLEPETLDAAAGFECELAEHSHLHLLRRIAARAALGADLAEPLADADLADEDEVVGVRLARPGDTIIVGTAKGQAIRFDEAAARAMGRTSRGVRGIKLRKDDHVIGMVVASDLDSTLITACEKGYGKRTPLEDYRLQKRGGQGVITIRTSARNGKVMRAAQVVDDDEVMLITDGGKVLRCPVKGISTMGRATQGVRVMNRSSGEKLASMARIAERDEDEEPLEGEQQPDPEAPNANRAAAGSNGAEQSETDGDEGS